MLSLFLSNLQGVSQGFRQFQIVVFYQLIFDEERCQMLYENLGREHKIPLHLKVIFLVQMVKKL